MLLKKFKMHLRNATTKHRVVGETHRVEGECARRMF